MPLLEASGLSKRYGGVHALNNASLTIHEGEVHGLCGENGAGKSTLIKILAGAVVPDHGQVTIDGRPLEFGSVASSEDAGIAVIHQELTAFLDLNAVDNIFVGRERTRLRGLQLDYRAMMAEARSLLQRLDTDIDVRQPLRKLSMANRQMVAMARALSKKCKLLIMDEPTASLSRRETEALLKIVRQLRDDGVSVLYVSHRLDEILSLATRVTVLRDGKVVETRAIAQMTHDDLVKAMVGRQIDAPSRSSGEVGPPVLQVSDLTRSPAFHDISFHVNSGEVVGLAGLVGAGRSEIVRAVFGIDQYDAGSVTVNGHRVPNGNPIAAAQRGIALVPEDRQHEGLILPMTIRANVTFAILRRICRFLFIDRAKETAIVERFAGELQIKMANSAAAAATLSGGNQQKLVLAKWLATDPAVLILDEPTRGIDIGAKAQFHQLIRELAGREKAVLVVSSDTPELLTVCDRILVICGGRINGAFDASKVTEQQIIQAALPTSRNESHDQP